jgi:tetratricopeptide (TPR) repeat protein
MPRADPTRSPYCASRHLLRNLDDAAELRRNPLVRACFTAPPGRQDVDTTHALDRVRGMVHASLTRCRERPDNGRAHAGLGRMHAALLRCEIDKQPLAVVAAEMGLSDRQVRRERRAAHDAFLHAFSRASKDAPPAAMVRDRAALRIAEATELHELGQSALAMSACEGVASDAPLAERRIEAICLAAEIDLDAARYAHASARTTALDADARALANERADLAAWSLRTVTGVSAGVGTPPPLAVANALAAVAHDEARRALHASALAAYALQRWEVGDAARGSEAVSRAQELVPELDRARTKERLAVMFADARIVGLRDEEADYERFFAIEEIAARRGRVRMLLLARAERICTELRAFGGGERVLDRILSPFEPGVRRTTPLALATAACVVAQCERDRERAFAALELAERLLPPRNAMTLIARGIRVRLLADAERFDEARELAQSLKNEAERIGNERVRGSAARHLAAIALAEHRRADAKRHIREALGILERFGTPSSLAHARDLARRLRAG